MNFLNFILRLIQKITESIFSYNSNNIINEFRNLMYQSLETEISKIDNKIAKDIYAISFYLSDDEDDPRKPMLTLGYNTKQKVKKESKYASSKAEAKWNYAYWLQNELKIIGSKEDIDSRYIWSKILKSKKLNFTDSELENNYDEIYNTKIMEIKKIFNSLAVECSIKLHENNIIKNTFKMELPIIIHELEYYEEIAKLTEMANPPKITDEFIKFVYEGN